MNVRKIRREHDDTFQTASDYVLDPTNTFRLMRRFTSQWKTVEQIIQQANDTGETSFSIGTSC